MRAAQYDHGEDIVTEGEAADGMYFFVAGSAVVLLPPAVLEANPGASSPRPFRVSVCA